MEKENINLRQKRTITLIHAKFPSVKESEFKQYFCNTEMYNSVKNVSINYFIPETRLNKYGSTHALKKSFIMFTFRS